MARYRRMGILAAALTAGLTAALLQAAFAQTRYSIPLGDSPSIGPKNAPVILVEFLDYQ